MLLPENMVGPSFKQVQAFLLNQTVEACESLGQDLPTKIIFGQICSKIFIFVRKYKSGNRAHPLNVNIYFNGPVFAKNNYEAWNEQAVLV